MSIEITRTKPPVRVSSVILQCEGSLDRSSYQSLLEIVLAEIKMGAKEIIIDLSSLERISLAGMVGLYLARALLEGKDPLVAPLMEGNAIDAVDGWEVIHRMCEATEQGIIFNHVRLLSRNPTIRQCLEAAGMNRIMPIMQTLDEAEGISIA